MSLRRKIHYHTSSSRIFIYLKIKAPPGTSHQHNKLQDRPLLTSKMTTRSLLIPHGAKSFQRFLQAEANNLRQSPVLLVASDPAPSNPSVKQVADATQWVQFTLAQQFGLRTVPCSVSSAYPSLQDLESRKDLLRRTGASSIVGVGSGAAIDLAKALAQDKKDAIDQLILVPSTYASTIASGASHSLFLDSAEETLVPLPNRPGQAFGDNSCPTTVAPLDSKYTAPLDTLHVLFGTLAVALDCYLRQSPLPLLEDVTATLYDLLVENPDQELDDEVARVLMYQAGTLLSFGLDKEDRSIPLALSSALIPTQFPHAHILTFWSALVPGLCQSLNEKASLPPQPREIVEKLLSGSMSNCPSVAVLDDQLPGVGSLLAAIGQVQTNQTIWKSFDVNSAILKSVLEHSHVQVG